MSAPNPDRREFLGWCVAAAGALLLSPGCGDDPPGAFDPTVNRSDLPATTVDLAAILHSAFDGVDPEAVRAVGWTYIAPFEDRGGTNALVAELSDTVRVVADAATAEAALTALDAAVAADFDAVTLGAVDGWRLARTEANLTALYRLLGVG